METRQSGLGGLGGLGVASNQDIVQARDQALELRVKVQASHAKTKNCIRHFDESREEYMNLLDQTREEYMNLLDQTRDRDENLSFLRMADNQLKQDCANLEKAMEELRLLHFELSNLDFALYREDTKQFGGQGYLSRLLNTMPIAPSTIETLTAGPEDA